MKLTSIALISLVSLTSARTFSIYAYLDFKGWAKKMNLPNDDKCREYLLFLQLRIHV
jgi:hypothetical protein